MFAIKQIKHTLSADCLLSLYKALIQPHLTYGIQIWGSAAPSLTKKTRQLQKRAIRLVTKSSYNSHTDPLFKTTRILKLDDMFEYHTMLFMYDYTNNTLPKSFTHFFQTHRDIDTIYSQIITIYQNRNPCSRQNYLHQCFRRHGTNRQL